jgi:thymidylate synthase (FAD)
VRHRIGAFSQQSQRYVNLVEDCWEDGNFVIPPKTRGGDLDSNDVPRRLHEFTDSQLVVEMVYKHLIDLGLSEEDARYVLPNATKTNIIWTTNFRNLIHVCSLRLCKRAQWEIRSVFERIVSLMSGDGALEDHRWMAEFLKPKCQILGYCDEVEGRSCRAMPLKAVVLAAWEKSREEKV